MGLTVLLSCNRGNESLQYAEDLLITDNHVHLMSPGLIADWKALGIPFSNPDYYYSDIDSILTRNNADFISLVGMGYVYENPEYYPGTDVYNRLREENDYLLKTSQGYEARVVPYFAVDPLKEYALKEIERCLKINEQAGLKLHFNASQVYLTEAEHLKKIKPIFELAAIRRIPILLHFDNGHPKFGKADVEILVDSVLKDLDTVRMNIAHFGTSGGFNEKTKDVIETFIELYDTGRIPERHLLKFDISAVALDKNSEGIKKLSKSEFRELKLYCEGLGYDKIIFGTDYPLYTSQAYLKVLKVKLALPDSILHKIVDNQDPAVYPSTETSTRIP